MTIQLSSFYHNLIFALGVPWGEDSFWGFCVVSLRRWASNWCLTDNFSLLHLPAEMVWVDTLGWRQGYTLFPVRRTANASLDGLVNITFMKARSNFKNHLILQSVSWSLAEFRHNKIVQSPHENYFNSSITLGGSGAKFPKIGKLYINYLMIQLCKFTPLKSTSW